MSKRHLEKFKWKEKNSVYGKRDCQLEMIIRMLPEYVGMPQQNLKSLLEVNLGKDKKSNRGFPKYFSRKRNTSENMGLLLNEMGDL